MEPRLTLNTSGESSASFHVITMTPSSTSTLGFFVEFGFRRATSASSFAASSVWKMPRPGLASAVLAAMRMPSDGASTSPERHDASRAASFTHGDGASTFLNLRRRGGPVTERGFRLFVAGFVVEKGPRHGLQLANARVDVVGVLLPRLVLDHVVEGIDELGGDARLVAEVVHAVPTLVDAVAKLGDEEFARALTRAGESGPRARCP